MVHRAQYIRVVPGPFFPGRSASLGEVAEAPIAARGSLSAKAGRVRGPLSVHAARRRTRRAKSVARESSRACARGRAAVRAACGESARRVGERVWGTPARGGRGERTSG